MSAEALLDADADPILLDETAASGQRVNFDLRTDYTRLYASPHMLPDEKVLSDYSAYLPSIKIDQKLLSVFDFKVTAEDISEIAKRATSNLVEIIGVGWLGYRVAIEPGPHAAQNPLGPVEVSYREAWRLDLESPRRANVNSVVRSLDVLNAARTCAAAGDIDGAIDAIYDRFDELLQSRALDEIDAIFERIDIANTPVDIVLSILTVTLPARTRLSQRKLFIDSVRRHFREHGIFDERLLQGLD